jgi:hypothetical protein
MPKRCAIAFLLASIAVSLGGQGTGSPSLTLLTKEGRRAIPLAVVSGRDYVALDDLASTFQLAVREEAGAITVSYQARTIVLTPDQSLASVAGRLVSLSAPVTRVGGKWSVPLDFISRALGPVSEPRLDLRPQNRLLVVGDLRVPRVAIRHEPLGDSTRIIVDATPRASSVVSLETQRLTHHAYARSRSTVWSVSSHPRADREHDTPHDRRDGGAGRRPASAGRVRFSAAAGS